MEEPVDPMKDSVDDDQNATIKFPGQQSDKRTSTKFPVVSGRKSRRSTRRKVDKDTQPGPTPEAEDSRGTRHRAARISVLVVLPVSLFVGVGIFLLVEGQGSSLSRVGQETNAVIGSISTAHRLMGFMNSSADPCEDFYNFACGSWIKSVVLRSDKDRRSYAEKIDESWNNRIRTLVENPASDKDTDFAKQVKHIYSLCNNEVRMEERGVEPFWRLLSSIGYFPMFDNTWNESKFQLGPILTRLAILDIFPLFELSVDVDRRNISARTIYINAPTLTTITQNLTLYREWLEYGLSGLGQWRQNALALQRIHTACAGIISRLSELYQEISNDNIYKRRNSSRVYRDMTLAEMDRIYNWLNWTELFVKMTSDSALSHLNLDQNQRVVVTCDYYLQNLPKVMKPTKKRELANYLMSSIVPLSTYLGPSWYDLQEFKELKQGRLFVVVRWLECTRMLTHFFPESISRMYVDHYWNKPIIEGVEEIYTNLKGAFKQILIENDWLSQDGKQLLLDKLNEMSAIIGYPSSSLDDNRLEASFITEDDTEYFEVVTKIQKQEFIKKLMSLRGTESETKKKSRVVPAVTLNIVNSLLDNEIIIPLALIQAPYYEDDWSNSMKYGTMGSQIGSKITAGFNIPGLYKNNWGVAAVNITHDREQYTQRANCYQLKYKNFTSYAQQLLGFVAVADSGGLRQSYRAYRDLIKRLGSEEPPLLGLEYTHDQVFFLSFAQFWCEKYYKSPKDNDLNTRNLPGHFRVLGTLQNSEEFAAAFHCPPNSRMSPGNKCSLW